jgi:mannan endo-1,4-beta-mannosidase
VTGQWGGGFQAEVKVTAGSAPINGWRVAWTFANGQTISQFWGARVAGTTGSITADNEAWNGGLAPGGSTTFGFVASAPGANNPPVPTCTAR